MFTTHPSRLSLLLLTAVASLATAADEPGAEFRADTDGDAVIERRKKSAERSTSPRHLLHQMRHTPPNSQAFKAVWQKLIGERNQHQPSVTERQNGDLPFRANLTEWYSTGIGLAGGLLAANEEATAEAGAGAVRIASFVYKSEPRRTLTVYYPDGWQANDERSALVIFRCRIPAQREHFRRLGMVVIKPQLAPVNSGQLPNKTLEEIASLPKPRHQVEDAKSVIRYLRTNAASLGIDPDRIVATGTSGGGDLALQSSINRAFTDPGDNLSVSHQPDGLVLYCPAFDGIDIWFVKSSTLRQRTQDDAPSFLPHLLRFAQSTPEGYSVPLDHRANLIKLAETLGRAKDIDAAEIVRFQKVLELFNARDWQLLHPVADALQMSASRILPKEPLPPTMILIGDRDHLAVPQQAFITQARAAGKTFDLQVYKGGGHSFMTQPAFEERSTNDVESFLTKHGFLPAVAK